MPDRDGVETVLALRRRFPTLRIIAMSGDGTRGGLDLGVAGPAPEKQKPSQFGG